VFFSIILNFDSAKGLYFTDEKKTYFPQKRFWTNK